MKITMFNQDLFKLSLDELYSLRDNVFEKLKKNNICNDHQVEYLQGIQEEICYREAKSLTTEKLDSIGINISEPNFTEKQKNEIIQAVSKLMILEDSMIPYYKFLHFLFEEHDSLHLNDNNENDAYFSLEYMQRFNWYRSGIMEFMNSIIKTLINK